MKPVAGVRNHIDLVQGLKEEAGGELTGAQRPAPRKPWSLWPGWQSGAAGSGKRPEYRSGCRNTRPMNMDSGRIQRVVRQIIQHRGTVQATQPTAGEGHVDAAGDDDHHLADGEAHREDAGAAQVDGWPG